MQPLKYLKLTSHLLKYHQVMLPVALAFASIAISNKAEALSFDFTFSDNTPQEVRSVFWAAGDTWSKQLTDDVTVKIFVDYGALPSNVLAGTRPAMTRVTYSEFLNKLNRDKSTPDDSRFVSDNYDDAKAFGQLQKGTSFKYLKKVYNSTNNTSSNQVTTGNTVWLSLAHAKALGITPTNIDPNAFDASIRISSAVSWNYDVLLPTLGKQDLYTVATHEIGHVLGFVSGVDASELLGTSIDPNLGYVTPMDMLRYSSQSAAQKIPDWTTVQTFFSLDGGDHNLGNFSRGVKTDGFQAGHWTNSTNTGIMRPYLKTGERWAIVPLDSQILDVIGWDYAKQLNKNVAAAMQTVNWSVSNPDLTQVANIFTADLNAELQRLAVERDAIKVSNPALWSELQAMANDASLKRQQGIQDTLNQVRGNRLDPNKRMESALRGVIDQLEAIASLESDYKRKLQPLLTTQISNSLNGTQENLKKQLKDTTLAQLVTLTNTVKTASQAQRDKWKSDIRGALRLLYLETRGGQEPSQVELNTALAKLLEVAAPDGGLGSGTGWRWWQTGDTKSSFEKTGEFTFHSTAAPEISGVESAGQKMGVLGLLGLLSVGFLLKVKKVVSIPDRG